MPPCGLHARRDALALEVDRQMNLELLVLDHALQIHVHHDVLRRMHLHVAYDRRLRACASTLTLMIEE